MRAPSILPTLPSQLTPAPAPRDANSATSQRPSVWAAVRRYVPAVVVAGAVAGGAAAAVVRHVPKVYEAEASVRVESKQTNLPEVYQRVAASDHVAAELDLLHSRTLAERVVDSLGLRVRVVTPADGRAAGVLASVRATRGAERGAYTLRREGAGFAVVGGAPERRLGAARVGAPFRLPGATLVLGPSALRYPEIEVEVEAFDVATAALGEALEADRASRESQVIVVRHRSADPTLARDVPNAAVAHFLAMRSRSRQLEASSTAAALREQIRTISRQLAASDSTLRGFRERGRVVDPKQEGSTQITRAAELQAERARLASERDALAGLMRTLESRSRGAQSDELPYRQLGGFPSLKDNQVVGGYVQALTAVEEQRAALLVRRTPQDPDVQALDERARTIERQLRATAGTYLDGVSRQTAAIDAELGRTERRLARIPGQEAEFARLERGPRVLGEMLTLLQTRLKEAEVAEAVADPTVQQLDAAILPAAPVEPRPARDVGLATLAGLMLGAVGVLVRDRLDRTVRSRDDVLAWARLPVIGVIPVAERGSLPADAVGTRALAAKSSAKVPGGRAGRRLLPASRPYSINRLMLAEAFARLQTRVAMQNAGGQLRTLVVTSPLSGEGKTTTAVSLATTIARTGALTLLIDGDLRRGNLQQALGVERGPGLAELLDGTVHFDDVVRRVDLGDGHQLAVVAAGATLDATRRLMTSARAREVLAHATARFDCVIVDAPPLNLTADAAVLAAVADSVMLVARAGQTPLDALARAAEQLEETRVHTIGVVVNGVDPVRDAVYDADYRYYADPYLATTG